jgi:uncharacterized protein
MQIHIHTTWDAIDPAQWNKLLAAQDLPTPFMRWEYLNALQTSNSATSQSGWDVRIITIWRTELVAACALYIKPHSYGEYVFDFAWANAYAQHGLAYYPKAVIAVPFTPVPGSRLLALDVLAKGELVKACNQLVRDAELSSLHLLFASPADQAIRATHPAFMPRNTTQFHWTNGTHRYANFDDFLTHLNQEKRKKIKQERRKVAEAGVTFRPIQGVDMTKADWDFFYRCYERTYLEHNNLPYLTPEFFSSMASDMPENWLMLLGEIEGQPIAASLIAVQSRQLASGALERVAYGRYWGALARVDCLHFEACYYQPIAWCIANGYDRFEGGAQGEHKMARALLPIEATSLHQIAHPAFAEAIERFLDRERAGVANYMADLAERSPMRQG